MNRYTFIFFSFAVFLTSGCSLEETQEIPEEEVQPEVQMATPEETNDTSLPENLEGVALIGVEDKDVAYSYYIYNQELQIYEGNIRGYGYEDAQEKYIESIDSIVVEVEGDEYTLSAGDFELTLIRIGNKFMRNPDNGDEYTIE